MENVRLDESRDTTPMLRSFKEPDIRRIDDIRDA